MHGGISVGLVDDQPLMLRGLENFIDSEPGFSVQWTASNGQQALEKLTASAPDVVLMDIQMPVLDGIAATRLICELIDPPHVVALTTFSTLDYVIPALRAGASGYLVKDADPDEILGLVQQVMRNELVLSPDVTRLLADHVAASSKDVLNGEERLEKSGLRRQEYEALCHLAMGRNNKEIAASMFVSEGSVKLYLGRACEVLGVRDRVQLLVRAVELGLVTPGLADVRCSSGRRFR